MADSVHYCAHCGKPFVPTHNNQKYCSKECIKDASRKRERERYLAKMEEAKRKIDSMSEISRIAREAKALGLSYGQYTVLQRTKGGT